MAFVYSEPTKRYTVDVNWGTHVNPKIVCILETNNYAQAAATTNFWDERCDAYLTDWTKAHWSELMERKFDALAAYIQDGAPEVWAFDGSHTVRRQMRRL